MIGKEYKKVRKKIKDFSKNEIGLKADNLFAKDKLFGINFNVRKGEILGISDLKDSNKYYIPLTMFGLIKKDSGEIYKNGEKLNLENTSKALEKT